MASGWSGVLSLPRVLSLREDDTLQMESLPELKVLRGKHHQYKDLHITAVSSSLLKDVEGDCLEIIAKFAPGDAEEFALKVAAHLTEPSRRLSSTATRAEA